MMISLPDVLDIRIKIMKSLGYSSEEVALDIAQQHDELIDQHSFALMGKTKLLPIVREIVNHRPGYKKKNTKSK